MESSQEKLEINSYTDLIDIFTIMIRKTMIIEDLYIKRKHKYSNMIYPLLEEAKDKLYKFYEAHLQHLDIKSDDKYVKEFLMLSNKSN